MKTKYVFIVLFILISGYSIGQNTKHNIVSGKIVFDISYPDSKFDDKTKANLPSVSTMYFKYDKTRVEMLTPVGSTIVISDNKSGDGIMLMDVMGKKTAVKMSKEELNKQKDTFEKPKIELTRESKDIAGYSCKKAVITIKTKDGEKSFDAWYTNELKGRNSFSSQIEGIDGMLMEFYIAQKGMSMKMMAKSVEVIDVADSEFTVPEGYELKTMDDLKKGMGKSK